MSRAFVNEDNVGPAGADLVERPVSPHPNYVTPSGALELQAWEEDLVARLDTLKQSADDTFTKERIAEVERDLRYVHARLESVILVDPAGQDHDSVLFGATIEVENDEGERYNFHIVGEDEADAQLDKVSWISPLAKALLGHKVGDTVVWQRPAGNMNLEILDIHYKS